MTNLIDWSLIFVKLLRLENEEQSTSTRFEKYYELKYTTQNRCTKSMHCVRTLYDVKVSRNFLFSSQKKNSTKFSYACMRNSEYRLVTWSPPLSRYHLSECSSKFYLSNKMIAATPSSVIRARATSRNGESRDKRSTSTKSALQFDKNRIFRRQWRETLRCVAQGTHRRSATIVDSRRCSAMVDLTVALFFFLPRISQGKNPQDGSYAISARESATEWRLVARTVAPRAATIGNMRLAREIQTYRGTREARTAVIRNYDLIFAYVRTRLLKLLKIHASHYYFNEFYRRIIKKL